jgi:quercetin dioxygenase-like cupin family protein
MRNISLALCALLSATFLLSAEAGQQPAAEGGISMVSPDELEWSPAPAPFPPGAEGAVLEGDPSQPGPFVLRFKLPPGYKVPPHWHTGYEKVTVLEGTVKFAPGASGDVSAMAEYGVGAYISIAARAQHYAQAGEDGALLQINAEGPFDIHFVNPDGSEKTP